MEENEQELLEQRILKFKQSIRNMIANSESAYVKSDSKFNKGRAKNYSRDEIDQIVSNGNPIERAKLSEYFFATNGLYKRIIIHYATFLTYSWILVPYLKNQKNKISDKKIAQTYYNASNFCTNFQIERKCAIFAKEVLVKGAYYGLLQDDGTNVVIQNLPFDYSRTRFKNQKDIDIVEFNVAFFDTIRDSELRKEILKTYPKYIEKAYNAFKYKDGPKWVFLPDDKGIYFSYFEERPFFLDLIPLLDDLEDYKEIDKKRNKQALNKIFVQKVGTDGLKLVFQPEEAEEMHEGVLQMLSNNPDIDVVTTYNDIDLIDLSSNDDKKTEIQDVQNLIYESAGLSKEFFFSTTDTGLKYSTDNDLAMMMLLGYRFAHFFTTLINYKYENSKIKFKFIIMPISNYNSSEYIARAKDLAAFGYSTLAPVLSSGIDQTSLTNLKILENELLQLDEILKPLQSAYTQSGKSSQATTSTSEQSSNAQVEKENETSEDDTTPKDDLNDTNDNRSE